MKLEHAKILFDAGSLKWVQAYRAPMQTGWLICVTQANGQTSVLAKARGGDRVFKSLDSVATAVGTIGFNSFSVGLS